jgi:hypothetical protein
MPLDLDLFGNERPASAGCSKPAGRGASLFDAASERVALASGRARSQERAEIVAPAGWSCLCGAVLSKPLSACPARCGR